jgi:hypothetical protein
MPGHFVQGSWLRHGWALDKFFAVKQYIHKIAVDWSITFKVFVYLSEWCHCFLTLLLRAAETNQLFCIEYVCRAIFADNRTHYALT